MPERKIARRPIGERTLRDLLLLVDRKVTLARIFTWSRAQRHAAERWARAVHLHASDHPVRVPPMPGFLR